MDVLNLFDIVKLFNTKTKNKTTKEAQLIGRGARIFPFIANENQEELKYLRKYDKDQSNILRHLEYLHYHSEDESMFIAELEK